MFDIDGTLVDSAGFDDALYADAVRDVLNVEVDRTWASYTHVTDSGVLEQLLRETVIGGDATELAVRVKSRFILLVSEYLARGESPVREIAGARRLVERLLATPGVRIALATGGWHETATLKLRAIGIDADRLAFASSSDAVARTEIMRIAAHRAMDGATFGRATYFGDGPWDRRASALLGYDFIAVGKTVSHSVAFDDLSDTAAILSRLAVLEGAGVS